jgi:hypothetical protein
MGRPKNRPHKGHYRLIWKGEVIEDYIPNLKEASFLIEEYKMAYNTNNIKIKFTYSDEE